MNRTTQLTERAKKTLLSSTPEPIVFDRVTHSAVGSPSYKRKGEKVCTTPYDDSIPQDKIFAATAFTDSSGTWRTLLTKVNIDEDVNVNSAVVMEILEIDNKFYLSYWSGRLSTGRVGRRCSPCSSLAVAKEHFQGVFRSMTNVSWENRPIPDLRRAGSKHYTSVEILEPVDGVLSGRDHISPSVAIAANTILDQISAIIRPVPVGNPTDAPAADHVGNVLNTTDAPAADHVGNDVNTTDAPAADHVGNDVNTTDAPAADHVNTTEADDVTALTNQMTQMHISADLITSLSNDFYTLIPHAGGNQCLPPLNDNYRIGNKKAMLASSIPN